MDGPLPPLLFSPPSSLMMDLVTLSPSDFYLEVHVAQGWQHQDVEEVKQTDMKRKPPNIKLRTFIRPNNCAIEG